MTELLAVEFRQWVQVNARTGFNGLDEEKKYVSGTQLKNYWSRKALYEIINTVDPPLSVSVDTIRDMCLHIFSVLVFIGKLGNIGLFLELGINDSNLPLGGLPDQWNGCLNDFLAKQWQFCPWVFPRLGSDRRQLKKQQILPIQYKGPVVREGWNSPAAGIQVVNIDDDYCQSVPREVVFKIYEGVDTRHLYRREAEVYTRLGIFNEGITNCYGSFEYPETNKRIIILEYTREGSLLDFFRKTRPSNSRDLELLWDRLLLLLDGLYKLHNPDKNDSRSVSGIHHDIQPANILVFREEGASNYDVSFKLADFGLAEIVRIGGEGVTVPIDNEGNRMYSAPEAYSNFEIQREVRPHLNSVVDLWSLGAVYSDFLVWSIGGSECQERYRIKRKDAIAKLPEIAEAGFDACFHDGRKVLPAVQGFHTEILKDIVGGDSISRCMSKFILKYLLVEAPRRLMAMQAKAQAINMIDDASRKSGPTPQRSITPETPPPVSNRLSVYNGERKVSVLEVYEALKTKRKWKQFMRHKSQPSDAGMSLPGMQNARNQIDRHGGRDQILVIDDSESMRLHKRNVAETARVISYSVKVSDKDGMDLYFASESCHPQKCENSSEVEAKIRNKSPVSGWCNMKKCLGDVMERVKENGTKPTGIYIFTDGIWDPEHEPEVSDVIHESINLLIEKNAKPADLMFQFIQFGRDDIGSKRLKFLDDRCKRTHRGVDYDIVDTKHCDDHVPKIIIGSISKHNDDDD
ncbi:hypothetical protein FNYG_00037 [Fusarium nygamai]|uniref:Protein kinase domain-containing protein n=1 Tax=Gibberella nygamai TaxID=42673 RepID=A0A2K0WWJ8_GIBNY|nr:hypothetical protein FNYG_00037 [Fusarium nygamai]